MVRTGIALFVVAVVATLPADARAPAKNSSEVVTVTATAGKIDNDKQTVTFTIDIDKEWHLYANPVGLEDLADNKTVVEISGGDTKLKSVKVTYPPGRLEKCKAVGDYMVYEGKIVITAEVVRVKDDTAPLKAKIKLNACSFKTQSCLQPGTVELKDIK